MSSLFKVTFVPPSGNRLVYIAETLAGTRLIDEARFRFPDSPLMKNGGGFQVPEFITRNVTVAVPEADAREAHPLFRERGDICVPVQGGSNIFNQFCEQQIQLNQYGTVIAEVTVCEEKVLKAWAAAGYPSPWTLSLSEE